MSLTNSPYWFGGGVDGFYPTQINDSLRFDRASSTYLNRTPSSGNRRTWTFSAWVKRGNLGSFQSLFTATTELASNNSHFYIVFYNDQLFVENYTYASGTNFSLTTNAVFRDVSAWYHIVLAVDTTQSTSSNRVKLYVNGEQVTSFSSSTYPSQNYQGFVNSTYKHKIGNAFIASTAYGLDGYLSDIYFIDGTALDPTSFGEAKDGTWIPKSYSGSYGTNGFHLEFNSNSNDTSGNGNNWTANNISSHDYVPDSPTNNFATFNPLDGNATSYSEGNLRFVGDTGGSYWRGGISTFGVDSGKWYWEMYAIDGEWANVGIMPSADQRGQITSTTNIDYLLNARRYIKDGTKSIGTGSNRTTSSYGASWTTGDIISVALDMDAGTIVFYKNGSSQGTAFTGISGVQHPHATGILSGSTIANFGQDSTFAGNTTAGGNADGNGVGDFKYSVPSGFLALCSANLPEPTIIDGSEYFNTVLYTGNNSTQSITGVGFSPSWVWLKSRTTGYDHTVYDVVRGATYKLPPNDTYLESADTDTLTSFDSDGFSVGDDVKVNAASGAMVSWNWKAGTAFSNSAGSNGATIASSGSVNTDAGFSIVSYTGDGVSGTRTIACGLTKKPDLVILRNRTEDNVTDTWFVYGTPLGSSSPSPYLTLYNTDPVAASGVYVDTSFSDNGGNALFAVSGSYNGVNKSGTTYISYCFHNVEGYSKVGSYTGNGSADGTFVYTGFRPAFLIIKRTNSANWWNMFDSAREPTNDGVNFNYLQAESSNSENNNGAALYPALDFLSNGFKLRYNGATQNASGGTYIYIAFAENPFKYANAR